MIAFMGLPFDLTNLWALSLLAIIPFVVLLYFLKLKRPQIAVASTLLWQKVIEDMRVNSPFQKLKKSILLLVQLLVMLALIFAVCRPVVSALNASDKSLVIAIDNSASMQARDENGERRLDQAIKRAQELVDNLGRNDAAMIVVFNSRAKILSRFTNNRRILGHAISKIGPTERPTDVLPALELAKSVAPARKNPQLILLSDGDFETPPDIELPMPVAYEKIGAPADNVAVTGLDIRRSIHDRNLVEMFVATRNFSQKEMSGNMKVKLNDKTLDSKFVKIGAGEAISQIFEATLPEGGTVEIELDIDDALDVDNRAWQTITAPVHRRVLIVGTRSFFISRVLNASPGTRADVITPDNYSAEAAAGYHTVIWNQVGQPDIAPAHNLYLGCMPRMSGLSPGSLQQAPPVLDWDGTHPINRFLDYQNLVIAETTIMKTLPPQTKVLLRSTDTPLITLTEVDGHGLCIVGFDPVKSNWPLVVSFPLFLNNALNHFSDMQAQLLQTNIRVGDPISTPARKTPPKIQTPEGEQLVMKQYGDSDFSFSDVDHCGIYVVGIDTPAAYQVAVNLFDPAESNLNLVDAPIIDDKVIASASALQHVNKEYWRLLVIGAALFMLFEWLIYHRRIFT